MIQPIELASPALIAFDGLETTTTDVWNALVASRDGDLARVEELVARNAVLACCKYNYAPPIHFAVREGHLSLVRFLMAKGGYLPDCRTDLFGDTLATMAEERGHAEIAELLAEVASNPGAAAPCIAPTDAVWTAHEQDAARLRFRRLLDDRLAGRGSLGEVEAALTASPELAVDRLQYWGEGVLAVPAKAGDRELVDLLLRHGASVPAVSKWCARYYFKRYAMAAHLLERGMHRDHQNWHHVTLLHEMAHAGDEAKAALLHDHGAMLNLVDEEYRSTPLGLAARRGQQGMVAFLLARGADPNLAGAPWATPLAWAQRGQHADIVEELRRGGAVA